MAALLCAAFLQFLPGQAAADDNQEKPAADAFLEPLLIEETMPNDPGELSLRLTTDYRRSDGEASGTLPELQLFYGLFDRAGASLALPLAYAHSPATGSHYGWGDVSTALKYLLVKPGPVVPALVLGLEGTFPTGSRSQGLGEGVCELAPSLGLLREFGPVCVQGNFAWEKQVGAQKSDRWQYGWAVSAPLVEHKLYVLTEIQGDWGRPNHATLAPGLKYYVTEKFTAGVAVPIGLNRNTANWGILTQFQFEF